MPNWCADQVAFTSNQPNDLSALFHLKQDLEQALETIQEGDSTWIGRLLRYKGANPNDIYCRGFIRDFSDKEEIQSNGNFILSVDSAWEPSFEVYEWMAETYDLDYVLIADEPGSEIFINTDVEGNIFSDRYYVYNDDLDDFYFSSLEEVVEALNEIDIPATTEMTLEELNQLDDDIKVYRYQESVDF